MNLILNLNLIALYPPRTLFLIYLRTLILIVLLRMLFLIMNKISILGKIKPTNKYVVFRALLSYARGVSSMFFFYQSRNIKFEFQQEHTLRSHMPPSPVLIHQRHMPLYLTARHASNLSLNIFENEIIN